MHLAAARNGLERVLGQLDVVVREELDQLLHSFNVLCLLPQLQGKVFQIHFDFFIHSYSPNYKSVFTPCPQYTDVLNSCFNTARYGVGAASAVYRTFHIFKIGAAVGAGIRVDPFFFGLAAAARARIKHVLGQLNIIVREELIKLLLRLYALSLFLQFRGQVF